MRRKNWPEVGTTMYFVCEHLYYIKDHAGPVMEFCVCEGEVIDFFEGGYTEVILRGPDPEGCANRSYHKLNEIGLKVFYTAREAALLAKQKTERYERAWSWLAAPDIPLRRTWEKYLTEAVGEVVSAFGQLSLF